jgi:uncharacterized phage protein (TIGR02216 family)
VIGRAAADGAFAAAAARLAGQAGVLFGWSPQTFWAATPAELTALAAAVRGEAETAPMIAADVAALIERFPDV